MIWIIYFIKCLIIKIILFLNYLNIFYDQQHPPSLFGAWTAEG